MVITIAWIEIKNKFNHLVKDKYSAKNDLDKKKDNYFILS